MGYDTKFRGILYFKEELKASDLAYIQQFLGADSSVYPEWNLEKDRIINLKLTEDFDGIEWDEGENTYYMVDSVNFIIRMMQQKCPNFKLEGTLTAQGDDIEDRWLLYIGEDGFANRNKLVIAGIVIDCPFCTNKFVVDKDGKLMYDVD